MLISHVDSYKLGHFRQYDPSIDYIASYIESRGTERNWDQMVVAGVEWIRHNVLAKPIVTQESLDRMKVKAARHGTSFNADDWQYIIDTYEGFAPVTVFAMDEGTVTPLKTPILMVLNFDDRLPWLGSYMEDVLLRPIWYASTVATQSFHIKKIFKKYLLKTTGKLDGIDFMLHDFGARGVSSHESAMIGGLAHAYSFMGSDTFELLELCDELYPETVDGMPIYSIDASEHSIATSWPSEDDFIDHILTQFSTPNKLFAIISDSYNIWDFISRKLGGTFKARVEALGDINARMVVRPDSGDPLVVVVKAIEALMDAFGYTINDRGYKVLPPYVRVIQGDGVNEESIEKILERMTASGLSTENIVFGMGGALLQRLDRDTLKFAQKACAGLRANEEKFFPIFKNPIDDPGKTSRKGLMIVNKDFSVTSVDEITNDLMENNLLRVVPPFGETTLQEVRDRINAAL